MRKFIFSILLASAAASPALAQEQEPGRHQEDAKAAREQAREERQQQREQAREERGGGGDFARVMPQAQPQEQPRQEPRFEARHEQWQGGGFGARQQTEAQPQPQQQPERQWQRRGGSFGGGQAEDRNTVQADVQAPTVDQQRQLQRRNPGTWDGSGRGRWGGDLREGERPTPNVMRDPNPLVVSNTPREGTQPPPPRIDRRSYVGTNWNTNWRNNHHYDWRRWRDRHRSTFRIGIYYDPFGWNYRPYRIGWRLWPSYYSRRFWINDPWQYRLPYAPPGTVWVRYWDDALLVDVYSGEVIDVIRDFFW